MISFIIRRIGWMFLVLFVISLITFQLMHAVPGGPFSQEKALPAATLEQLNAKYNLDAPLYMQYFDYIVDITIPVITRGEQSKYLDHEYMFNVSLPMEDDATLRWVNFGPSFKNTNRTVNDIFRDNLPVSIHLGFVSFVIALLIGVPLGVIAGLKRNSKTDYMAMFIAIIGVSVPVIILAPVLQYWLGVELKWLPVTGWGEFRHVILPAFTLGFAQAALIARLTRASLLQVMNNDYIRTARAKGIKERHVVTVHALRNSLIPVVTIMGPMIAFLITGTFVVETVFGIPGMGKFFVTSITGRDYPVIMGTILLYAVFLVMANLVVDIVYVWLDPRIEHS